MSDVFDDEEVVSFFKQRMFAMEITTLGAATIHEAYQVPFSSSYVHYFDIIWFMGLEKLATSRIMCNTQLVV